MKYAQSEVEKLAIVVDYMGFDWKRDHYGWSDEQIYFSEVYPHMEGIATVVCWWELDPVGFDLRYPLDVHKVLFLQGFSQSPLWNAALMLSAGLGDHSKNQTSSNSAGSMGKWTNSDGSIKYPPNNGFSGTPTNTTLRPGTVVDRYGAESGSYVSPQGTPYASRSLPPGSNTRPYNAYEVLKPIDAKGGIVAPWFDQPGGGTQYRLPQSIAELILNGFLRRLP